MVRLRKVATQLGLRFVFAIQFRKVGVQVGEWYQIIPAHTLQLAEQIGRSDATRLVGQAIPALTYDFRLVAVFRVRDRPSCELFAPIARSCVMTCLHQR